jgi:hypothetical protein
MRALAAGVVAVSALLAVAATVLAVLNWGTPRPPQMTLGSGVVDVLFPIGLLTPVALGAVIAMRQPRHAVAWCFMLLGLGGELLQFAQNYALYSYALFTAEPGLGRLAGADIALWFSWWAWVLPTLALSFAILTFPDGHLPSARWRPVAWATIVATIFLAAADAVRAPLTHDVFVSGPTAMTAEGLAWLGYLGTAVWGVATLAAGASLVVRFRRSRRAERQQLKWVAYAATIAIAAVVISNFMYGLPGIAPLASGMAAISVLLIPIAAAVAILRYRLFDIDVVIERTLVYGAVSATLGATYITAVVLLQGLLRPVTGGSEFAVAMSTLLVVALFQPIRSRAQDAVDRRFYRARYDAARTIDAFSVRLRSDVELDSVREDLIAVIHDTMHPAHASVWLRGDGR